LLVPYVDPEKALPERLSAWAAMENRVVEENEAEKREHGCSGGCVPRGRLIPACTCGDIDQSADASCENNDDELIEYPREYAPTPACVSPVGSVRAGRGDAVSPDMGRA